VSTVIAIAPVITPAIAVLIPVEWRDREEPKVFCMSLNLKNVSKVMNQSEADGALLNLPCCRMNAL
jgi:hypothetical protein